MTEVDSLEPVQWIGQDTKWKKDIFCQKDSESTQLYTLGNLKKKLISMTDDFFYVV